MKFWKKNCFEVLTAILMSFSAMHADDAMLELRKKGLAAASKKVLHA
jgi:hypothetical protein